MEALLEVRQLNKSYPRGAHGMAKVLRNISFSIPAGVCLGIVGESGCGKSTLCRLMCGLERPTGGQVLFHGEDITRHKPRGSIQMVFQNSLDAVNLYADAFHILSEPLQNLFHMKKQRRIEEAARLMELVGLSSGDLQKYPRQFSGGQLQRVCIARALAAKPELLILDEPLSSLDVSVQAQILNLLKALRQSHPLTYILISHDLKAVYYLSDALLVMHRGILVEQIADIRDFPALCHPYTLRLLASHDTYKPTAIPDYGGSELSEGCPYAPRCPRAGQRCIRELPPLQKVSPGHSIACFHLP